jgi:hypothetical protein
MSYYKNRPAPFPSWLVSWSWYNPFVMCKKIIGWVFCVLAVSGAVESLHAQGTAFTYQGQLNDSGSPASGSYDLTFSLYNSTNLASPIVAGPITNSAVAVTNGLFTTVLNFGSGVFTGTNYWLEIAVRASGWTNFTPLVPLQPLTPTPYAVFANTASNLSGTLPSAQLSGALPSAQISGTYSGVVMFSNSANSFIGAFSGNGSSLSNLNASQLTSGTVADVRLSANVPLLNATQTFSGASAFTNTGNSFRGSFFGNGLVGWLVQTGTTVQAVSDTGYLLTNSQLVTVTLPVTPNVGDIVRISGAGTGGWQTAQNTNQSVLGNFSSYANSYWTSVETADYWQSIASSSDGTKLVASTYDEGIFIFSGGIWSSLSANPTGAAGVASSANGSQLVAAVSGGSGTIFIYTNSATGWVRPAGAPTGNFQAVASSSDGTKLVAVVNGGVIYVSTNSGSTWVSQSVLQGNSQDWYSVASSANGSNLVAVVYGGGIYTNSGNNYNWSATSATSQNWISVASSSDGSKLVAAVFGGGIYTSANSGSTWIQQANAPSTNWYSVASSADGAKLAAVVHGGGIYLSSDSGSTWIQQSGARVQNWISIASSSDGTSLAAAVYAASSGIYVSQASTQASSMTGTNGFISGGQGTAVELQYIGNGKFMPVSSAGSIWAN